MKAQQTISTYTDTNLEQLIDRVHTELEERRLPGLKLSIDSISHSSHYNGAVLYFTAVVVITAQMKKEKPLYYTQLK